MCGRVFVKGTVSDLVRRFAWAAGGEADRLANTFPRYNGAPRQQYPIIVLSELEPRMQFGFVSARWGFIPRKERDPKGGRQPINARSEGVATNFVFRDAYRSKRALMPIDGFFEWKDIFGDGKNKQPYAVAMKDGGPFAIAAIYDVWRDPATGEDIRTFCVLTTEANAMMAKIHDRMPVILHEKDYQRWLGPETDPRDLLVPFPSELMTMWPIGRKVGNPRNDTADILDPVEPDEPLL